MDIVHSKDAEKNKTTALLSSQCSLLIQLHDSIKKQVYLLFFLGGFLTCFGIIYIYLCRM